MAPPSREKSHRKLYMPHPNLNEKVPDIEKLYRQQSKGDIVPHE
jgi:hypothetical protein